MKKTILNIGVAILAILVLSAFTINDVETDPKSKSLLEALAKVNGGWQKIASKKDVEFTYRYHDLTKGTDLSTERYIFDGEASWAEYRNLHTANIMTDSKGVVKQNTVKGVTNITLNGEKVTDEKNVGTATFFRAVNFYWLTMMYKLEDPGTVHKYIGKENINGIDYDKISLSYDAKTTGKEVNDEYILYFNPETHLVDLFFFSLPAWGINKPVLRMELGYNKIEDVLIATSRKVFAPNPEGKYSLLGVFSTTDVKFNNGFTVEDFKL